MNPQKTKPEFPRIVSFDFLRIFFIISIVMLHAWEHFVGEDLPTAFAGGSNYEIYQKIIGTVFNYAALYVLSLSFFLWGMKGLRLRWAKILILCLGLIGLQLRTPDNPTDITSWAWEIYSFLFISILVCRFWPRKFVPNFGLFLGSLVMLSIPPSAWNPIADQTVEPWRTWFFSNSETPATIGWFLIPWIFVPFLAFTSGSILSLKPVFDRNLKRFAYPIAAGLVVVSLIFYWLKPEPIPAFLGSHFYSFLFLQSSAHFWNHYLIFAAVVILCLRWETSTGIRKSPLRFLSYLQWNRNFFLCYFFHFAIIVLLLRWRDEIVADPNLINWLWLGLFLFTEIMMQLFVGALRIYALLGRWFILKLKTKVEV